MVNRFNKQNLMQWAQREHARLKVLTAFVVGAGIFLGSQIPAFATSTFNALNGFQGVVPSFSGIGAIVGPVARITSDITGIITVIAIAVTVVMVGWGGINLATGSGTKKQEGMERIKNAMWGLFVAIGAGVITGIAAFLGYAIFGTSGLGGVTSNTASTAVAGAVTAALIAMAHTSA